MNKLARTTAREIQTVAVGSGIRAHQLFDKLVEAIYCSFALTAPTSQQQIDTRLDRFNAVVGSNKFAGLEAVVLGDLLVSFATSGDRAQIRSTQRGQPYRRPTHHPDTRSPRRNW